MIAQEDYKGRAILLATNSSVIREHYSFVNTSEEKSHSLSSDQERPSTLIHKYTRISVSHDNALYYSWLSFIIILYHMHSKCIDTNIEQILPAVHITL